MATTTGSWSTTKASVPTKNVELFCLPVGGMNSNGIFAGGDPMESPVPLLLFQLGLFTLVCRTLQILLKPFKQHIFVPQVLSGIVLGPSFLGRNDIFRNKIFTKKSLMVLDIYALIGYMFLVFLAGVRTNLRIIKKCGRLGFIIGFGSFILPSMITSSMAFFLRKTVHMDLDLRHALPLVAMFEAATSFHVTHGLLMDLKLLNSELGRLALSSSLISGFCSWAYTLIVIFVAEISPPHSKFMAFATNLCKVVMVTTIIFIFRPIMFWMIKQTPEGKTLKESYILAITLTVFGCALFGEVMGIDYLLGPVVFGLAVPDGPPMGSSIVEKLDGFVSAVFLPCYIMSLGRKVDVFLIGGNNFMIVAFIVLVATLVKLLAIMIPSLYFKMPILDALSLSLILNCRGYFDIAFFERARDVKMITEESFIIMVIMAMLNTATFTPLVGALYDPSKRYVAYKRRTIQHSRRNAELRILACIHQPDDVPTIINILETSNPTRQSPIGVYVLDMVKLQSGHATSQLINHRYDKSPTRITSRISHIIKAFRRYELHNQGIVTIQCFTTISPYATMHDDICALALEKSTSLVIIPFRVSFSMSMRTMNKKVLENAPCSVGILIDRRMAMDSRSILVRQLSLHICMVFLGGPDDREALAYATRMAEHPTIRLTVLRIIAVGEHSDNLTEKRLDMNAINDFRISTIDKKRIVYEEEGVTGAAGTARVVTSLDTDDYELILVGRRHDSESPLVNGLADWKEIEELGVIGDMLGSSDFKSKASVLVVQQQALVVEEMVESHRFIAKQLQ